jgi:hypothetical protein
MFDHAFDIAFSVVTDDPTGDNITGEQFAAALQRRIDDLNSSGDVEWHEAVGAPFDTFEVEDD